MFHPFKGWQLIPSFLTTIPGHHGGPCVTGSYSLDGLTAQEHGGIAQDGKVGPKAQRMERFAG